MDGEGTATSGPNLAKGEREEPPSQASRTGVATLTDDYFNRTWQKRFAARLNSAGVAEPRCSFLSSPMRCLETLQYGDTARDALVALCMHMNEDLDDLQTSDIDWQAEACATVFDAVAETALSQPTFIKEGATIQEAKSLLDAMYSLLIDSDRVDEEVRDSLGDCRRDTRQFRAWFYGRTVGLLKIMPSYLEDALLNELDVSDWVGGWAAASMLVEQHPDWVMHRKTCMSLYWASDVEYKGARPWNVRQPAHLSPSSDLYWAMRVGYCDAHIETGWRAAESSSADLGEQLQKVEQIVSSGGIRHTRSHQEAMQGWASLLRAMPTESDSHI